MGELGDASFRIYKLGELGEVSFGMLKLGELGEMSFKIYKLGGLGEVSFGMLKLGELAEVGNLTKKMQTFFSTIFRLLGPRSTIACSRSKKSRAGG